MRLLLDTHVLLAVLHGRVGSLGREVAAIIGDNRHVLSVSVVSLWEIAIKFRLGKLPLGIPLERLPFALDEMHVSTLPITSDQVLAPIEPEPATRDPFDRLLLAICQTEQLRLITVDRALVGHRLAWTMS